MRKKYILLFLMIVPPIIIYITHYLMKDEMNITANDGFIKASQKRQFYYNGSVSSNDSCIFHYNTMNEKEIYTIVSDLQKIDILFKCCYEIYGIFPATGNVEHDKDINDIKIIRYIYPNPLEFVLLLPIHLENDKNVLFNIKTKYSFSNLSESIVKYFSNSNSSNNINNNVVETSDMMDIYLLSTMHLRYIWTYYGSKHFRENMEEIMKDPYTFKYYYEKNPMNMSINYFTRFDTNHSSIYPNNELGIIERLRYRNNIEKQMEYYRLYDNLTTIIFGQNNQFIDYRPEITKYINMNIYNIYLIWCSNYNSGFYLSRLLHLLLKTEYTVIIDDDFVLTPNYITVSKYIIPKYNCIVSNQGFQSLKFFKFHFNKSENNNRITVKLWFVHTLYGGQIAKTEMFTYPFRMKLPFKYWGDDVGNGQIGDGIYGLNQVVIKGETLNLKFFQTKSSTSESHVHRKNYKLGPTILCPFITYCGRYRKNVTWNKLCFFPIPSVIY